MLLHRQMRNAPIESRPAGASEAGSTSIEGKLGTRLDNGVFPDPSGRISVATAGRTWLPMPPLTVLSIGRNDPSAVFFR